MAAEQMVAYPLDDVADLFCWIRLCEAKAMRLRGSVECAGSKDLGQHAGLGVESAGMFT